MIIYILFLVFAIIYFTKIICKDYQKGVSIQECIDNNDKLKYGNQSYGIVQLSELENWKEWFITNQSAYCLNNLYTVTRENKIEGIKLFNGQSLTKLFPETKDEIIQYLGNIIEILNKRAKMMNESIH